ncbi:MAG TPA: nucleotidyltransferase family protein [Limnobacter sp.]|nr:nucleotidyltransferase family protein [Limnobacter sp.]
MHAMILAAGRGERMRPLTDHCPKPLLKAGGKPLLQWHLEALRSVGIRQVVINHAHLGHQIESAFGDGHALGLHIQYSAEASALETAGGIAKALPWLGEDPFVVINGDVSCDWPIANALAVAAAWQPGQLAHLVLVPNPVHHPQGDFALKGGLVQEGDTLPELPRYTFSGIGVYAPALFASVPPGGVAKLAPLLRGAMAQGKVSGELHAGFWMDVGTPQRLQELDDRLTQQQQAGQR